MTQPEVPPDNEFEKITDGMSCLFLTSSILDIDEMIIQEPTSSSFYTLSEPGNSNTRRVLEGGS